jgi:hypothetical protein
LGLLAHYILAAYRYGSEELLRALRIAIRRVMCEQLRDIEDRISAEPPADEYVPTGFGLTGVRVVALALCCPASAFGGRSERE